MSERLATLIERHMVRPIDPGSEDICCGTSVCAVLADLGWPWPGEHLRHCLAATGTVLAAATMTTRRMRWPEVDARAPAPGDVGVVEIRDRTGTPRQFLAICNGPRWCTKTPEGVHMLAPRFGVRAWRPQ